MWHPKWKKNKAPVSDSKELQIFYLNKELEIIVLRISELQENRDGPQDLYVCIYASSILFQLL